MKTLKQRDLTYLIDCIREVLRLPPLERHTDAVKKPPTDAERFYTPPYEDVMRKR